MNFDISIVLRINEGRLTSDYRQYYQLVDYFNHLTTTEQILEEKTKLERIDNILNPSTNEEKWDYAELEFEGNIIDNNFQHFCWLDLKQYPQDLF